MSELDERLAACRDELHARDDGFLSFATRRAMLRAIGPTWSHDGGHVEALLDDAYVASPAHVLRARLALGCAERALPAWARVFGPTHPHRIVEAGMQVLQGRGSRLALRKDAMAFQGSGLASGADPGPSGFDFLYAGHAAAAAAQVVFWDELLFADEDEGVTLEMLDAPEDPDHFDTAAWAAASIAGDFPWTDRAEWYDAERARAFWRWYLDEAVPALRT